MRKDKEIRIEERKGAPSLRVNAEKNGNYLEYRRSVIVGDTLAPLSTHVSFGEWKRGSGARVIREAMFSEYSLAIS